MDSSILAGLARHVLTSIGGALAAKGVIAGTMVEPLVGAVLLLAGVIWSVIQKRKAE